MKQKPISSVTTRFAVTMSVLLALAIPASYFVMSYQFMMGSPKTEADINARLISGIISTNPLLWHFEQVRLEELLTRRPRDGEQENRRIFNWKGDVVAESVEDTPFPLVSRSHELLDSGMPVGRIEIIRSLRPLIGRTLVAAIFGVIASFIMFRILPYRTIIAAQNRLEDANEFLNTVMESSTNAIIVVDNAGTIKMANHRGLELTGFSGQELSGGHFLDLFDGRHRDLVEEELHKVSSGGAPSVTFETRLAVRGGDPIHISCGIALFRQDGQPAGMVISAEDITGRKKAELQLKSFAAELEQTNAELRSFAYIISHDLRAPLVNIRGFSVELNSSIDLLRSAFEAGDCHIEESLRKRVSALFDYDIPEALDFINGSVVRMDRLITAVLKLSRMGHLELKPEPVQLREMVDSILKSMSHQIEARQAKVRIGELPEIVADRIALEQIMGNLLDNAVKYLDPDRPGELAVYGETGPSAVTVHVRDNGRGISQEDQFKIFEIFRRAGRQDVQGDGMGLTYVRTLVRKLRGEITCQSQPGVGSTFSFSIPVEVRQDPAPENVAPVKMGYEMNDGALS